MHAKEIQLRDKVLSTVKEYYHSIHGEARNWKPGDTIPYAGRVFDEREMLNLAESLCDFWLTSGRFSDEFEKKLASFLGVKHCSLCNSGSSANLLAFSALTSPSLGPERILPGDEVITTACCFPTTVAPVIQYGAVPVFVDISLPTYNLDVSQLEAALSPRTKAVFAAHTLGNPFDLSALKAFCDTYDLWLIEDNCDALGSQYRIDGEWRHTGSIGDIATSSFYPPHHITMGEGGAVYTNDSRLYRIVNSLRDWGRDCWCPSGHDNTCGRRFNQQFGELPFGYDHKYVYSHFGYNMKATEMQASIGCAQIDKLPIFIEERRKNWAYLKEAMLDREDELILPEPTKESIPSWFGFVLTLKKEHRRNALIELLESAGIQTRLLFAGNIVKQPCFDPLRASKGVYRIVGSLEWTDRVMNDTFWVGVYPGLDHDTLHFLTQTIISAVKNIS